MSPSVARKSPTRRHSSRRSLSPERDYDSPRRREKSPIKSSRSKSPSRVERSPVRRRSSHKERGSSPARERYSSRTKSPKREKSNSPVSRSPSPRTKRLRRANDERQAEKASEKEHTRNHDKGGDKSKREKSYKDVDDEVVKDRREHRSEKERVSERDQDKDIDKDRDRYRDRDRERDRDRGRARGKDRERDREREKEGADDGSVRSRHRNRNYSRSPPPKSRSRDEDSNLQEDETGRNDGSDSLSKMKAAEEALTTKEKHQPQFGLSGKLAEETNRVKGVTLLFNEPPDARKPDMRWRLYVFKNGDVLNEPLYVHRQSCYLFGRERRVADIPTDHPSCSKQHAVLQFRQVEKEQPDGMMAKQIRPYLMDLGSTNKTFLNDNPIEPQRYYELLEKDTIKFGNSSREYVLLHEQSAG